MIGRNRREFLVDVGRGALAAGLGASLTNDLGLGTVRADAPDRLTFGASEPLVSLMQDTPPDKLLPLLVKKVKDGTELKELVAAGALANARAFGGEDYTGYHTLMALAPAYHMANEMPAEKKALPVLKVLYRNSKRIQDRQVGHQNEVLHPVAARMVSRDRPSGEQLREAVRAKDMDKAEGTFAAIAKGTPDDALAQLLMAVEEAHDVHRIVLPYRAWCLLDIVGLQHAHTLLRQSVRYCVNSESPNQRSRNAEAQSIFPKLLDQYKLAGGAKGRRSAEDAWINGLADTIFRSKPAHSAEAAAAALAEGFEPAAVGEAISLATNQLVLRDAGRPSEEARPGKPVGSVHGDSIGVHACDSANAWRHLALVGGPYHAAACLILGAYQAARDRTERGGDFLNWQPRPWAQHRVNGGATDPGALVTRLDSAIRSNDQAQACAIVARIGELNANPRPVFDVLLKYGTSEEGALHAEKYYRTVSEDFAATRPAFRWRHLIALARVTASEYGQPADGYADACRLLGV